MSTKDLSGKIAIVTGASSGIGRAIALALAQRGATVVVVHANETSASAARQCVAEIEALRGKARAMCCDVTVTRDIARLFHETAQALGGVDIVVSNAGGDLRLVPIADTTEEDYDRSVALNAKGNFFVLQAAARSVRDGGRIVVTSSSATAAPYPGCAVYAGAKAAAEMHVRVLAKELGPREVTVNAVSPGLTDTATMRAAVPPERIHFAVKLTPLGRLGMPQDIADVVAFLASDDARWITGQNLRVGGGVV